VSRWRFGIGWWSVVLFGLPVIALVLGLIFGGSLHTADVCVDQTTRLDGAGRGGDQSVGGDGVGWFLPNTLGGPRQFAVAAVLTTLPLAGMHVPLVFLYDHVSVRSVLSGLAGLLILGIVVRLLMV
jgi:hypothetical protein